MSAHVSGTFPSNIWRRHFSVHHSRSSYWVHERYKAEIVRSVSLQHCMTILCLARAQSVCESRYKYQSAR